MSEFVEIKQPQGTFQGISAQAEIFEIKEALEYREPVDYIKIWGNLPVLFFGERHTVIADKDEIINNLPNFKKQGLTHVAMEMFREDQQPVIDQYFNGEIGKAELSRALEGWDKRPGIIDKYIEIVDTAKDLELKLLALDLDCRKYSTLEMWDKRNKNWARIINNAITTTQNGKVLVYCGSGHSGYNMVHDHSNEILNTYEISSAVVSFSGADKELDPYFLQERIAISAKEIGAEHETFQLKLNPAIPTRPGDYIVHLPDQP